MTISKLVSATGGVLLLFMAAYHGSGVVGITADITQSNAPDYLKTIFPVLFMNTSLYLATLSVFAFYSIFAGSAARGLTAIIAVSSIANAGLGAFLGEWMAAGVLATISALFIVATLAAPKS
jgi:hypothetical protein